MTTLEDFKEGQQMGNDKMEMAVVRLQSLLSDDEHGDTLTNGDVDAIRLLLADHTRLQQALKPFAEIAITVGPMATSGDRALAQVELGHCRRAARVLGRESEMNLPAEEETQF